MNWNTIKFWTALGAISTLIAVIFTIIESKETLKKLGIKAETPNLSAAIEVIGDCNLEPAMVDSLKNLRIYDEMVFLCKNKRAWTVGQAFCIPNIHPNERFQFFNPVEFLNDHAHMIKSVSHNGLLNKISDTISTCYKYASAKGASPHERIGLEIDCLQNKGFKTQDKVYYMIVQNGRAEGRNVPS